MGPRGGAGPARPSALAPATHPPLYFFCVRSPHTTPPLPHVVSPMFMQLHKVASGGGGGAATGHWPGAIQPPQAPGWQTPQLFPRASAFASPSRASPIFLGSSVLWRLAVTVRYSPPGVVRHPEAALTCQPMCMSFLPLTSRLACSCIPPPHPPSGDLDQYQQVVQKHWRWPRGVLHMLHGPAPPSSSPPPWILAPTPYSCPPIPSTNATPCPSIYHSTDNFGSLS